MKTERIRHAGIITRRPEMLMEFYEKALNMKKVWDKIENINDITGYEENCRTIKLASENGSQIELVVPPYDPKDLRSEYLQLGISHIALTVTGMEEIFEKVKELKCEMLTGSIFTNPGGIKIFFCKDPDGNVLELVEDPKNV